MTRLNQQTLRQLPKQVSRPNYDRQALTPGIVHLGIGAFHRAHQAFYTEEAIKREPGPWGIIGCSLRSTSVRDQLAPQDGLYTLVERSNAGEHLQVIGSVKEVLVGPEDPAALVARMADPAIRIVSLTVTEKGYCHDPSSGNLNVDHPDIQHDLRNLDQPRTAVGLIVAALDRRRQQGLRSFTALSCDNLPHNGKVLARVVMQFAEQISRELLDWIQSNTTFPCTMIDRIVPATTDGDRHSLEQRFGLRDEGLVLTEPFTQWVIEDKFADGRPAWESAGALLVKDVQVFEDMKLRLLNGSHSLLAYTGYLAGFDYISEVMGEPVFVKLITRFMDEEAGTTLTPPPGFDLDAYKRQLRERFANKALQHRTWQIAMDGSQKLPQRFLATLRDQLHANGPIDILCLAVAAWIRYVSGVDEKGNAIEISDPLAEELKSLCDRHRGDTRKMVEAITTLSTIFGEDLIDEPRFIDTTSHWLECFYQQGVMKTLQEAI